MVLRPRLCFINECGVRGQTMNFIVLKDIFKSYGDTSVLRGLNLEIQKKDFTAIVGKSGAGKSTLMNILGLVEYFDAGHYYFGETEILSGRDYSHLRSNQIGFVFQNYNLISSLTCKENILLPTLYSKCPPCDVYNLAQMLDIEHLLSMPVGVLSGGEKQRIALARALVLKPKVIIADEPTGNLDKDNKNIVIRLLTHANEDGCAVVLITHDYYIASNADKIFELRDGILHEKYL